MKLPNFIAGGILPGVNNNLSPFNEGESIIPLRLMTVQQIIEYALPVTKEHRNCRIKMQKLNYRRDKLRQMIEAYKRGDIVNWAPLKISVDIEAILKQKMN